MHAAFRPFLVHSQSLNKGSEQVLQGIKAIVVPAVMAGDNGRQYRCDRLWAAAGRTLWPNFGSFRFPIEQGAPGGPRCISRGVRSQ